MSRSVNMVLAGFGGQGVLFAGKLIACACPTIPSEARSCSPPTCSLP